MRHRRSNVHGQPVKTVLRNIGWLAGRGRSQRLGRKGLAAYNKAALGAHA